MQSEQTFNISDVSQQTGVAAVTLRAWESRYGLIKPSRTPKGHRLYKQANINEIQQIVAWLDRGVAIRKVASLLASNELVDQIKEPDNHWLNIQQEILAELIKLKQRNLNQLIDQLNKATPFISLCEHVYQPIQVVLNERWQNEGHGFELELQLWQQCWQRQIALMTLRADKQKSHACCTLVNLGTEFADIDYWLFHGLLLQSGVRIDAINNIKEIACLNRLNNTAVQPIIVFSERGLGAIEVKQLSSLLRSWRADTFCAGWMADIHSDVFSDLAISYKGGSASDCWQSTIFQAWLTQIGDK